MSHLLPTERIFAMSKEGQVTMAYLEKVEREKQELDAYRLTLPPPAEDADELKYKHLLRECVNRGIDIGDLVVTTNSADTRQDELLRRVKDAFKKRNEWNAKLVACAITEKVEQRVGLLIIDKSNMHSERHDQELAIINASTVGAAEDSKPYLISTRDLRGKARAEKRPYVFISASALCLKMRGDRIDVFRPWLRKYHYTNLEADPTGYIITFSSNLAGEENARDCKTYLEECLVAEGWCEENVKIELVSMLPDMSTADIILPSVCKISSIPIKPTLTDQPYLFLPTKSPPEPIDVMKVWAMVNKSTPEFIKADAAGIYVIYRNRTDGLACMGLCIKRYLRERCDDEKYRAEDFQAYQGTERLYKLIYRGM